MQEEMQDLDGETPRKKWSLPLKVVLHKKKQKPLKEPRRWRNGRGPLRGWRPSAGQNHNDSDRGTPRRGRGHNGARSPHPS